MSHMTAHLCKDASPEIDTPRNSASFECIRNALRNVQVDIWQTFEI